MGFWQDKQIKGRLCHPRKWKQRKQGRKGKQIKLEEVRERFSWKPWSGELEPSLSGRVHECSYPEAATPGLIRAHTLRVGTNEAGSDLPCAKCPAEHLGTPKALNKYLCFEKPDSTRKKRVDRHTLLSAWRKWPLWQGKGFHACSLI